MLATVIRSLGFVALGVGAIAAYFLLAPKIVSNSPTLPSATQYESLIASALSDYTLNETRADTAPKQQVVNGWVAKDLLTVIAKEDADILRAQGAVVDATGNLQTNPFDERVPALLLIAVLALIWSQLTNPQAKRVGSNIVSTGESEVAVV